MSKKESNAFQKGTFAPSAPQMKAGGACPLPSPYGVLPQVTTTTPCVKIYLAVKKFMHA